MTSHSRLQSVLQGLEFLLNALYPAKTTVAATAFVPAPQVEPDRSFEWVDQVEAAVLDVRLGWRKRREAGGVASAESHGLVAGG